MGIRGYPFCLSSNRLQITGYPCFRVSIPCVLARVRGYPFLLVRQGRKSYFRKAAVALGFCGYPGYPSFFVCKFLANYYRVILLLGLNSLGFRGYPGVSVPLAPQGEAVGREFRGEVKIFRGRAQESRACHQVQRDRCP